MITTPLSNSIIWQWTGKTDWDDHKQHEDKKTFIFIMFPQETHCSVLFNNLK